MRPALLKIAVTGLLAVPLLASCGQSSTPAAGAITVDAQDKSCTLSATTAQAGKVEFDVTNNGSQVNEFYLYAADGTTIVGELENLGPGLSRSLTVNLKAGDYISACRPNGTGSGMRGKFTVRGTSASPAADTATFSKAQDEYAAWVRAQSTTLVQRTKAFAAAYASGKDALARQLYPRARTPWEAIETVAESFSDLDARTDTREADLAPGQKWTGWHRIEKDLWPQRDPSYTPMTAAQRRAMARDLIANVSEIHQRIQGTTFTLDQIANGSSALMEEVATGKVTGEEEYWSGTDLWDFAANVVGARKAFELVRPVLTAKDPSLERTLTTRFATLDKLLAEHRGPNGYASYGSLSKEQVKVLADAVNAVSEPLSQLTSVVLA